MMARLVPVGRGFECRAAVSESTYVSSAATLVRVKCIAKIHNIDWPWYVNGNVDKMKAKIKNVEE